MEKIPSLSVIAVVLVHSLILSLIVAAAAAANGNNITDQQALLALKARVTIHDPNNPLSKNWTSNTSVCTWMGVTCDADHYRVTVLNLSNLNLTGTIPSQLVNLSSLRTLNLSYNQFSGTIPSSIFSIYTLRSLVLSDNQLSGSFPSFSNISSLEDIALSFNRLSGELPANICDYLPYLESLLLSGNVFHGDLPPSLSKCRQMQYISFSFNSFSGAIPKELGNLTKLKELYLGGNKFQGEIPQELGNLAELEDLSVAENFLIGIIPSSIFNLSSLSNGMDFTNNNLTGTFPNNMCQRLPLLKGLYMSINQFIGPIPQNLWQCRELVEISLSINQFTGPIPKDIGNLTSLKRLFLGNNNLMGEIPHEMGNLRNIEELGLQSSNLVGAVPAAIFNLSTMTELSLLNNSLSGSLPSSIDIAFPNLRGFVLGMNNFSGKIPNFIFNASKLSLLEMGDNSFSGFIPATIGNLRNLVSLGLRDNYLKSSTPDLSFLSSLAQCKNLKSIVLQGNPIDGVLPRSLGNLSVSLEEIFMEICNIRGSIPEEIGNLINLTTLNLGYNRLTGSIPISLSRIQKLQGLGLQNNRLEGSIPDDLCLLPRLVELHLYNNKLSGSIPSCLGNITSLRKLLLGSNQLTSVIPSTFWNLRHILVLNFSLNSLNGSLSLEIGNLNAVVEIDFSRNNFSGDIPTTIGGLEELKILSLEYNSFQGPIPESFGGLTSLESLDLSENNLSGIIPISLEKLLYLKDLNLSFNRLEGEIPRGGPFTDLSAESFIGNDLLCGSPHLQVPPCKSSTHQKSRKNVLLLWIVLPLCVALTIVVTLALGFVLIKRCRKRSIALTHDLEMSQPVTRRRFSYLELLRATDGFSENNLIGKGSFGSVFKARFQDGMEVAVKVFHLQCERAFKSFDDECEVMKSIRHRNLVKIISSCSNDDFKALILEYMPNRSLEEQLYSNNCSLDILQRLNIMIDVASALEYLHFGYSTPIVHCDLKPNNVLLDENMVARLSDFGIAKLLTGEDQSMTRTQTLATIGYMAPEYGREGQVSTKGDIYSYGIMLMETFTRKKPTNEIFSGEINLHRWVQDSVQISVMEVVDTNLLSREDDCFAAKEQCISSILILAIKCTRELPEERINAKEIVTKLIKIRDTLFANIGTAGSGV